MKIEAIRVGLLQTTTWRIRKNGEKLNIDPALIDIYIKKVIKKYVEIIEKR